MSSLWMPLNDGWTFDALSALIGAGVGLAAGAGAGYYFRARIGQTVQSAKDQVTQTRDRLTMGVQQRYLEWVTNRVTALHVLKEGATLSELYLVPEFVTPLPRPALKSTVLPPPTVPLSTAMKAATRLVITGCAGSGRSAALAHIARVYAQDQTQATWGFEEHRLPIYLHGGELSLQAEQSAPLTDIPAQPAQAKPTEPVQPLMEAVTARLPLIIQPSAPGLLRSSLKRGEVILLLDGLDEIEAEARANVLRWIRSFCETNASVRVVLTAAPAGLAPLLDSGFTALPLAPWTASHVARLAERWTHAAKGGEQDTAKLAEMLKPVPGTSPSPLDVTLAAFLWQKRGAVPPNRATAYGQMVDLWLEGVQATSPLSPVLARAAAGRLALLLFKENCATVSRAEIEKLVVELLPPPPPDPRKVKAAATSPGAPSAAEAEATPTQAEQTAPAAMDAPTAPSAPPEPPKPKGVPESVEALIKSGLLVERRKDYFAFAHRRMQSYLAAWQIIQSGEGALLTQHLEDATWSDVYEFCTGLVNISPLVDMLLKREDDLFRTRLWTVAGWAASAGPDVAWRGKVLAQVAQVFMQPNEPPPLREKAMLALLSTQDKGLGYLFKQALTSPDATIRALALRGLGLLGREQDLLVFDGAAQDPDPSVREAAVRAMGSGGFGAAGVEHLAGVLLEADESLRQVAALTLAECGAEGQRILKDAVREEDMLVRRATTFGLAATRADWAQEILSKLEKDDPQWFVRSAATEALANIKNTQEYQIDCSPLALEQQGWLVEWGATRGLSVGLGRSAEPVLMRALNDGDAPVRIAAIHALAHMGTEAAIEPLRAQLGAPEPSVQNAAYQALRIISERTGARIARKP